MEWKKRYEAAHRKHQEKAYPSATKDFGWLSTKYPNVEKHNGLRSMIIDFLKWNGHHAEVSNTMGRPVEKLAPKMNIFSGKIEQVKIGTEWQKGSGTLGSSDIKSHIAVPWQKFPIPVYIEVKVGRDWQRPDQEKYEAEVTSTGALYWLVWTPEEFFELYDKIVSSEL